MPVTVKVHVFWEGHKNCQSLHCQFDVYCIASNRWWRFHQFLWPSQKTWTLKPSFPYKPTIENWLFDKFVEIQLICYQVHEVHLMRSFTWTSPDRSPFWKVSSQKIFGFNIMRNCQNKENPFLTQRLLVLLLFGALTPSNGALRLALWRPQSALAGDSTAEAVSKQRPLGRGCFSKNGLQTRLCQSCTAVPIYLVTL